MHLRCIRHAMPWFFIKEYFARVLKTIVSMSVGACSFVFLYCMSLLSHLKEYRQFKSIAERIPVYSVFGDTVLQSIVKTRPSTSTDLQSIRGFSKEKCDLYGLDIIRMVQTSVEPPASVPPSSAVVLRHRTMKPFRGCSKKKPMFVSKPCGKPIVGPNEWKRFQGSSRGGDEGIYILELSQGRVYVGQSSDIHRRVQQHMSGQGSAFTKAFPPTGVLLPRLGCVSGSQEAAERDETLRYMFLRGIQLVRGWKYTRVYMPDEEIQDAEGNIRELFDLCRRCGHPGHFVTQCKATFDRLGRPCTP